MTLNVWGQRGDSLSKTLSMQEQGPEFHSLNPCEDARWGRQGLELTGWGGRDRRVPEAPSQPVQAN